MKRFSRYFGPVLVTVIFVLAVVMLCRQFTLKDLGVIGGNMKALVVHHPWSIASALALAWINYVVLMGYDLLAVRYLGINVPARKVAFGAFTAYTCGFNFGATLAGTSVRYRLYSAWGVPPAKILQLLIVLALTFWVGMLALGGVVFIVAPLQVPPAFHLPIQDTRPLGVALLATTLFYVGVSFFYHHDIPIFRWKLPVPPFKLTVCQIAIASADLLLVAGVLYSLWPPSEPSGYFQVLGIYMLVFVIGVLTHVPGGYGAMEAVLVAILVALHLPESDRNDVIASWLLFRVIYYILPLLLAVGMLGWYEWRLFKRGPLLTAEEEAAIEQSLPESWPPEG